MPPSASLSMVVQMTYRAYTLVNPTRQGDPPRRESPYGKILRRTQGASDGDQ